MQAQLFGLSKSRMIPVPDADMWSVLRELRAASELAPFRLWLVGSRVELGNNASDIDLVLSPRVGFSLDDRSIESALWYCRHYGLCEANPQCVIDPCFRIHGPTLGIAPLRAATVLQTVKLFSPKLSLLVAAGRIKDYRRLGRFSIAYLRRAKEADYYGKLPRRQFDGFQSAYLRPAIEIPVDEVPTA
jgi:hypothetical protein